MNMTFGACPRCKMDISAERRSLKPIVCNHCGFATSKQEEVHIETGEKHVIVIFSIFVSLFLFSYIQLLNWDSYSLEIIPLKIKETIGATTPADMDRTAEICLALKKWDCVETNYSRAAVADQTKLARLGDFQMKRAKYNEAAQTYYSFFKSGGNNLDSSYNYAKALTQLGQVDEATKYFEQVLGARPDVLQITVVQNYVKLLMDHQRFEQAKTLIQNIRRSSPGSGMFMETEFKKIQDMATASRE